MRGLAAFALCVFALAAVPGHAVELCINSSAALQSALTFGQLQQSDYTIKLVQGAYLLDFSGAAEVEFVFSTPTTIVGGYNANCTARVVNPASTSVDFSGSATEVTFNQPSATPSALLAFDGLTLKHGARLYLSAGQYGQLSDTPGSVRLSGVRITDFQNLAADSGQLYFPLSFLSHAAEMRLQDVQIDHIVQLNATTACAIELQNDEDSQMRLVGTTIDLSSSKKLCFGTWSSSGNYSVDFDDSILWGSDGGVPQIATVDDFNVASSFVLRSSNSIFHAPISGVAAVQVSAALNLDPQWVNPAAGDYHLKNTSPAVNSGTVIVPGGLPATDIEGNVRWIGSLPDRGAYESPFNDATGYVVTTTLDSGAGSLRDAITQANSLPNPASITFAIPGACPRVITLSSVLPAIASPVVINGASQAGSIANSDPDSSNATLCVVVKPASGTLSRGFSVAAGADQASLTLRGVGLGGFGQPVQLLGGSNHVIAGNQFGGSVGGVSLPGAGLYAITLGVNASGSLIIGGLNPADRNVIGGGAFGGISVQAAVTSTPDACQIVNNLIGLAPNGITALPNFSGVDLGGSGCSLYGNRIAGNTKDNVWINGGSNNVIQRNIIGVALNDSGFIGSAGIRITGGNGNVIGASATSAISGSLLGNTIRYNLDGGVLAASGSHNSIRSNLIHDNGLSGDGMDIDLNADGATPNDADDADSGSNNLQNFPWTASIVHPADDANPLDFVLSAHLNTLPGSYRIDAYFSNRCDNGAFHVTGRGHADAFVGTRLVTVPADGNLVFDMPVTVTNALSTGVVSLTATNALGDTSEIGSCAFLSTVQDDRIFQDGFDVAVGP